ncbi:hypothetical protein KK083_26800 [Fulvivirgaceae bacterium PWU4]|uniref:EpsG family protein n=1 Tax=Chryseosolibacter histidini TaxID=2782349 RepID=A0AAP2DQC3_9BACT|nr:hypothetical protein [Chryseosolibacter histidini]MBT1700526.1 hypothetical protein [Chryseosolibacter histidini]
MNQPLNRAANAAPVPFVLFLIMPFGALIAAVRNYKFSGARNLVWLFIVFYGFTFVISNNDIDANRYQLNLSRFSKEHGLGLSDFTQLLYSEQTSYIDVVQPLLTFIVSRFTDNGRVLFAFFGLIFGFFYSRNLWFLLSFVEHKLKKEAILFIILFALIVAIWQINGFRFWTAAHIFVYGLFQISAGHRIRGFLICLSSLLVHFSFVLPAVILLIYFLVGNRLLLLLLLYFSSFFISQVSPDALRTYASFLPTVLEQRSSTYVSKEYLEKVNVAPQQTNWYIRWRVVALMYVINVMLAIIFFKYRGTIAKDHTTASILSFGLMLFTLTNLMISVPSLGVRFQLVSLMIIVAALFLFVQTHQGNLFPQWIRIPFILAALLFIVVEIRVGFNTLGMMTVVGNPLTAPFVDNDVPLIDLIK